MTAAVQGATVLLADRDPRFVAALEAALQRHRLHPERVGEREDWMDVVRRVRPDVVVLSERPNESTVVDTLVALRRVSAVPVVILLERGGVSTELLHFGLGADDVVLLPASPRVVAARVARIVERAATRPDADDSRLRVGPLTVDRYRNAVTIHGVDVEVTPFEFRMLVTLAAAVGRAFSRSELIGDAMPESEALERTVDVHVWNLRRKFERAGAPSLLETIRGVGYRLVDPDRSSRYAAGALGGAPRRR